MTNTIERVTLENAAEQLKSKIRTAFVELLPEEQWKEMVTTELKRFTEHKPAERDGYGNWRPEGSEFSKICREVFTEHIKTEIKSLLNGPEWHSAWGNDGRQQISSAIKAWLTEHSVSLIQATVQAMAGQAAQHIVSGMR